MEEEARVVLQRVVRKVPSKKIQTVLRSWKRLSEQQLRALDYTQPKWLVLESLASLCEDSRVTLKDVTKLEMVYYMDSPNQGTWHACQLLETDDVLSADYTEFKELFTAHLEEVYRHISIRMMKLEDGAVWIRIAWGDNFSKPNHFKPTYIVHYLQTPYVFMLHLMPKHKPFVYQAIVLSTRRMTIKEASLSARSFSAVRDLLMKQYKQVFPNQERTLKERNGPPSHPKIQKEHAEYANRRCLVACEAFGDGMLPKLETAVYKLETRYKGSSSISNSTLGDRDELFRGVVKFSSINLLESLRHCMSTGMAEGPITPLLSSITQKARNYFVITDKVSATQTQKKA